MNTEIDDEELTFGEGSPVDTAAEIKDVAAEPAPEAEATAAAAKPPAKPPAEPAAPAAQTPAEEISPSPKKRSRTGMAVAAGFAICIVASITSAVQAWRVASLVAHTQIDAPDSALTARLNNIQKLLEQQRDALDGLSARPDAEMAGDNGQIAALASAVRANQEMNERLPSMVMQQVNTRLAGVKTKSRAGQSAPVHTASEKPAAKPRKPFGRPAAKPVAAVAKVVVTTDSVKVEPAAQPVKRPAGEAIRYP